MLSAEASVLGTSFPSPSCSSLPLPAAECGRRRNSVFVGREEMLDSLFRICVLLVQNACSCMQRADAHPSSTAVGYLLPNSMGCRELGSTVWKCLTFKYFTIQVLLWFPVS